LAIDDYHGVGSEDEIVRTLTRYRERLVTRQTFGTVLRGFSGQRVFWNICGLHLE
jgi:hypothetical protein